MTRSGLFFILAAVFAVGAMPSAANAYTFCKGKYALCTTAKCTPVPGEERAVSCACEVRQGFSAGHDTCKPARPTTDGEFVQSRYFPVKSFAICNNDRPWADCLGKACTVDKDDPTKATCACTTYKDQGPYVIVGDTFTPATCSTGIISSATVADHKSVSEFLKSTPLKPFHVKVLNPATTKGSAVSTSGKE